ncbi:MAG: hypothetical protein AAGF95_16615 [Chloroflexota bacterium]
MRYIANVRNSPEVKRLMIYSGPSGAYLFFYSIEEDGSCDHDLLLESVDDAMDYAAEEYGLSRDDWQEIDAPLKHCQHDWIAPARVPGRETDNPQWGQLEVLRDGEWVRITC